MFVAASWKKPRLLYSVHSGSKRRVNIGVGGLELFVNGDSVGQLVHNNYNIPRPSKSTMENNHLAVGCFNSPLLPEPTEHASGNFDEVAIWHHQLAKEELDKLMGGFGKLSICIRLTSITYLFHLFHRPQPEQLLWQAPY